MQQSCVTCHSSLIPQTHAPCYVLCECSVLQYHCHSIALWEDGEYRLWNTESNLCTDCPSSVAGCCAVLAIYVIAAITLVATQSVQLCCDGVMVFVLSLIVVTPFSCASSKATLCTEPDNIN